MNWGTRIFISFVVFMAIMITMVVISVKQDFFLVADDYYEREIRYQEQIDRIENHKSLADKPRIQVIRSSQVVQLAFPESISEKTISGEIHFFRPSDARIDQRFELELSSEGIQEFQLNSFRKGMWRAKIFYKADGLEYYTEQPITI
jgi:nitrogen fixation protein FixH